MKIDLNKFDFESHKILSALKEEEKAVFMAKTERFHFKKGKLIFYEGGIPTGTFLLLSGRAKIYKTGLDAKDQIFYIYTPGDMLGYHALLCHEPYEDSCEALEDCELLFIRDSHFQSLLHRIPTLQQLLIQNMSHEFGVMVNVITVLAQKPLRERLALFLLILDKRYGDTIELPREDLANLIGTARESLGRLLKEFKEDHLIAINKRSIALENRKKLLEVASSQYNRGS